MPNQDLTHNLKSLEAFQDSQVYHEFIDELESTKHQIFKQLLETVPCDIKTFLLREQLIGEARQISATLTLLASMKPALLEQIDQKE